MSQILQMVTTLAHIGGQGFPKSSADSEIGFKIDTFDLANMKEELTGPIFYTVD